MIRVVVAGSGGLVGSALIERLKDEAEVIRLVRPGSRRIGAGVREVEWNPPSSGSWARELEGAAAVVNLCGAGIADRRWTPARKKELIRSRFAPTQALVSAMAGCTARPAVFVSASAIGFYGPRDTEPLDESDGGGKGFLADLCREWERQALKAEAAGIRTVVLRTGVVLSSKNGALRKMLPPFRLGLGGPIGDGRQIISWIHVADEVEAIARAIRTPSLRGPVNLTAPEPVSMRDFSNALSRALGRPAVFPVPAPLLRFVLGEMSEMFLTGQKVLPAKLRDSGFVFRFPKIDAALEDLLSPKKL